MTSSSITVRGYFVNYDKFNKAKLMFLDDYNDTGENYSSMQALRMTNPIAHKCSFTKSYLINKANNSLGNTPIVDAKYFLINCPKNVLGTIPNTDKINLFPIQELVQHTVECNVIIRHYKFTDKNRKVIQGWNIKLINMRVIAL